MFSRVLSLLSHPAVFSFVLISSPLYASYDQDHPLFAAYPNADLEQAQMYDYEKFSLPASVVDASQKDPQFTKVDAIGDDGKLPVGGAGVALGALVVLVQRHHRGAGLVTGPGVALESLDPHVA